MDRTISYIIGNKEDGLRVEQVLRRKGYSRQNLSSIKRMPESILVNGVPYYMRRQVQEGDTLTVRIREAGVSEKIPSICRWISSMRTRTSSSSTSPPACPSIPP